MKRLKNYLEFQSFPLKTQDWRQSDTAPDCEAIIYHGQCTTNSSVMSMMITFEKGKGQQERCHISLLVVGR